LFYKKWGGLWRVTDCEELSGELLGGDEWGLNPSMISKMV
tara:strand:- start:359 stop:478 length:120 start_codon:yes stop_codon:yes gene_type:complete